MRLPSYVAKEDVRTAVIVNRRFSFLKGLEKGSAGLSVYGTLASQGTPVNLNHLASGATVQEMPTPALTNLIGGNGTWLGLNFRFTELPTLGGATYFCNLNDSGGYIGAGPLTLRDNLLHGGQLYVELGTYSDGSGSQSSLTLNLTNNVFDRCAISVNREFGTPSVFYLNSYNNLYHGGSLTLYYDMNTGEAPWSAPSWPLYDNLFENNSLSESGSDSITGFVWIACVPNGYNGYVSTTTLDSSVGGDKTPAAADYQVGALGSFYYPTNGGNLSTLIHAGSTSATNLGLYHYTVTTNNVVEGTNTVSIGFHYVAVETKGRPIARPKTPATSTTSPASSHCSSIESSQAQPLLTLRVSLVQGLPGP